MSRHPCDPKDETRADATAVACDRQDDSELAAEALALFGEDAGTAVAYCGIDAWFEGSAAETQKWARIFARLKN
ncbi:MAG: hypothetical protein ACK4QP_14965 [Pseudorhizobium sp.]